MKLTKSQRHIIYILLLAEAEKYNKYENGLCHILYYEIGIENEEYSWYFGGLIRDLLPELQHKYLEMGQWPSRDKKGWDKRIEFLKQCIRETY